MTSPSDFSRRSAFSQTPSHLFPTPKVSKAPQHNPYDKFTQDEFDAWIGGITSALKRALGQEDELVSLSKAISQCQEQSNISDEEVERLVEFIGESSDEDVEASFDYPTARRVSKGKARDPRDGPGFGRGDQNEPIFIDSDSEEDDKGDDEHDEVIEGWDSQSEESDEDYDVDWEEAESSVQARIRHEKQAVLEVTEDDDEENEEEGESEGEDDDDDSEVPSPRQTSSAGLVLDSDEEDEIHDMASEGRASDETESAGERFDGDTTIPLSTSIPTRIGPPRYRAKQQHVSSAESTDICTENDKDMQPSEDDTSFPPHDIVPPTNEDRYVELSDRWVGPETYAQDYYSGGDFRGSPNSTADSLGMEHEEPQQVTVLGELNRPLPEQHHLSARHDEMLQVQDVIRLDGKKVDVQPLAKDTSFPPKIARDNHDRLYQPIEIPDPWAGPKTYAEDFYSGGDIRPLQNGVLDPHHLGDNDESVTLAPILQHEIVREEVDSLDKIIESGAQPRSNMDADVSSNTVYDSPQLDCTAEFSEPWDGTINYGEDYSVEVEDKSSPQIVENQSGIVDDNDATMIIGVEDEVDSVKLQDVKAIITDDAMKIAQERSKEGVVSKHMDSLATSGHEVSSVRTIPARARDFNIIYGDFAATKEPQHPAHDQSHQSQGEYLHTMSTNHDSSRLDVVDMPGLEWMNDSAFIHDMPNSAITELVQPNFGASISDSTQVDFDKEVVKENECLNVSVLETQLPTSDVSTEKTAEAFEQAPDEDLSEVEVRITSKAAGQFPDEVPPVVGLNITSEASEVDLLLPPASVGPLEVIEDAGPVQHDNELEVRSLPASAPSETEAAGKSEVDINCILEDNLVAPEVEEVKEIDVGVDVGGDEMPDLDAVPKVHCGTLAQDTIVEYVGVPDADSASLGAPKESIFGISEPVATADSDKPTRTYSEPELIVSPSTTPILGEGLQSVSGNDNTSACADTCESDSQVALVSHSLQPSANVAEHTCPTGTSQPRPLDPPVDSQNSASINEPPRAASEPAPDYTIMTSASETSQFEDGSGEQNFFDSLAAQGSIPGSDMVPALSDQENGQLSSSSCVPAPALPPYSRPWTGPYPLNVVMRKASEPVLLADPYPASLSTPDDADVISYEQFFRQSFPFENSMAESNTVNGEIHSHRIPAADNSAQDAYVQSNDKVPDSEQDNTVKVELASNTDLPLAKSVTTALSSKSLEPIGIANLSSMVHGSTAKYEGDEKMEQQSRSEHLLNGLTRILTLASPLSSPVVECADGPTIRVRSPPLEDDLPSILIIKKVHADGQTPVNNKARRSSKRKRRSSIATISPLPRTSSLKKSVQKAPAKPRGPSRKTSKTEKGKEVAISPTSQRSFDTQSISSRSSSDASAARRMLAHSSRGTSRASSIASTSPGDNHISNMQPSPTFGRGSSFRQQPLSPLLQVPLLHRHHHNRPQPSRPVQTQRASLSARQHDLISAEPSTSKQNKQNSSSLHRHPTYSSSPVTRSNCRYHKISIPLDDESDEEGSADEDVKLVYFLVPGCSLGNKELNRDEKIVDHGDAQPSDSLLMTPDLDSYAFNAPLLSVLRLLVGVDMLREGEIYYLPLPGSDWVPRKAHDPSTDHIPSHVTPRRNSNMPTSSVINATVLSNSSASTSTPFRPTKPSSTISQTSSELTEVEDSPQSKCFRSSLLGEEDYSTRSVDPESSSRSRKLKHLSQDAAEHRPASQDEANNSNEHVIGRIRSNKGHKLGLKRSRTSDVVREPDVDGQKLKKQKT